jgi:hypothetical protein
MTRDKTAKSASTFVTKSGHSNIAPKHKQQFKCDSPLPNRTIKGIPFPQVSLGLGERLLYVVRRVTMKTMILKLSIREW